MMILKLNARTCETVILALVNLDLLCILLLSAKLYLSPKKLSQCLQFFHCESKISAMSIDRGSFTPPPSFNSRPSYAPKSCKSENRKNYYSLASPSPISDQSHVRHKVPAGDSPYVRAKRVQLIEKDPKRSISLFWRAINSGDRVDSALKDMALVMKQLDRSDEAIEAIKSFRHLCSTEAQQSVDNILIELYKCTGRMEEQIEVLQEKLNHVEEEALTGVKRTKMARSQGKKIIITPEQEYSRLLGNLAWAHLQQNNFKVAEEYYRKGLSIELDRNKQCNLALCLMHMNRIKEAKLLLQSIKVATGNQQMDESYAKSYERAHELLDQIESQGGSDLFMKGKENYNDRQSQLDHIDNMSAVSDAKKSGSTLHTPVVSKWKSGSNKEGSFPENMEEVSSQHLYTQPINRKHRKTTETSTPFSRRGYSSSPITQPRRFAGILGCGAKNNGILKPDTNLKKPCTDLPNDCKTDQDINDPNTECSDPSYGDNVEQANDFFLPSCWSCKSGKSWADMVEEEEEEREASMDYTYPGNGSQMVYTGAHSSARRSLSFDHEEKQDTGKFDSLPPKPKSLLTYKGSNDGLTCNTS
ncbi:hypothetical protein V2J09_005808 [Rumex salicifolius]